MKTTTQNKNPWPKFEASSEDGRKRRSGKSRRRIIEAMFELLREGEMSPKAIDVAERAGVGLRTVFRHFEDLESIFEEMTEELKAINMPKVLAPLTATDWRERLLELADRNADLYESVFPMQVALSFRRFRSNVLQRQYQSEIKLLRSSLELLLPAKILSDSALFSSIEVCLTFSTWRRLREDQRLSVKQSKEALHLMLRKLTDGV